MTSFLDLDRKLLRVNNLAFINSICRVSYQRVLFNFIAVDEMDFNQLGSQALQSAWVGLGS
jgi:hypothetical protein